VFLIGCTTYNKGSEVAMKNFYVNAFGKKVEVCFTDSDRFSNAHGAYSHIENKIFINTKNTSCRDFLQVFLHEYSHFVLDRLGFYTTSLASDIEELIVENISMALSESFYRGELDGILEESKRQRKLQNKQPRKGKKIGK
jgi:hypothetical protein